MNAASTDRIVRIGIHNVAAVLEEPGVFDIVHLDFAADALGALAPLEFEDDLIGIFFDQVFRDAIAGVFDVHLHNHDAVAVEVAKEHVDAPVQFRRNLNAPLFEDGLAVHADDVLAHDDGDPAERGADGKGIPVTRRHESGTQRAGHHRDAAFDGVGPPELRGDVHFREDAMVGVGFAVFPVPPISVAMDAQGVVAHSHGGHVAGAGRDVAELSRIQQFPPPQGGHPRFTFAFAGRVAQSAQTRLTGISPVAGSQGVIVFSPFNHNHHSFLWFNSSLGFIQFRRGNQAKVTADPHCRHYY